VSFTFRCALIFVDNYAHTLFLEVNFVFHVGYLEAFARDSLHVTGRNLPQQYIYIYIYILHKIIKLYKFEYVY
jgi:hypothetical protein